MVKFQKMIAVILTATLIYLPLLSLLFFSVFEISGFSFGSIDFVELGRVIKGSSLQAFLSATLSIGFGFVGALGLKAIKKKQNIFKIILLTPNFLPPLVIILSVLDLTQNYFWPFSGNMDVVFAHAVINIGLCAVLIESIISSKNLSFFRLAFVEGASDFLVFKSYVKYLFADIFYIFVMIFFLCFSSFSIPLILGGYEGRTIEVLIFELVRLEGNFAQGILISVFEIIIFLSLFMLYRKNSQASANDQIKFSFYRKRHLIIPLASVGVALWSLVKSSVQMFTLDYPAELLQLLPPTILKSSLISLSVGLAIYFILNLLTFALEVKKYHRFIYHFNLTSSVLLALGAYLLKVKLNLDEYFVLSLALVAIIFPALYRARGFELLNSLRQPDKVASTLGAKGFLKFKLFFKINHKAYALLAAIGGFWAFGDFAVSKLILDQSSTLPLLISDLIKSYRIDLALALNWVMLIYGGICFLIILGVDYVLGKTSNI
ncbi:hypothetical protein N9W41_00385 [bacterium]|nr:hypothetical protein [bacterium]